MTDVQTLSDWIAICEQKARYCRFLDTKQWDLWTELFTEDFELDVSQESGQTPIKGRTQNIAMVRSFIDTAVTAHQVHLPEITIKGDEAQSIFAMQDRVTMSSGPAFVGYGHYHESWRRENGTWKIAKQKLTRQQIDPIPASAQA